ncbi:hypothetical protein BJ165DRAFT_243024 [Panaeolus papilionaceus]|nr:hypothetical protein BJ165DRAFT_243024 [Panaeolus papilionaceus]
MRLSSSLLALPHRHYVSFLTGTPLLDIRLHRRFHTSHCFPHIPLTTRATLAWLSSLFPVIHSRRLSPSVLKHVVFILALSRVEFDCEDFILNIYIVLLSSVVSSCASLLMYPPSIHVPSTLVLCEYMRHTGRGNGRIEKSDEALRRPFSSHHPQRRLHPTIHVQRLWPPKVFLLTRLFMQILLRIQIERDPDFLLVEWFIARSIVDVKAALRVAFHLPTSHPALKPSFLLRCPFAPPATYSFGPVVTLASTIRSRHVRSTQMPSLYLPPHASTLLPQFVHDYTMQGRTLHIRPLYTEGAKGDDGWLDALFAPPSRLLSSLAFATPETAIAAFGLRNLV